MDGVRKQTEALLPAGEAGGQGGRWKRQEQVFIDDANGWGAADLGEHIASMVTTFDEPMVLGYGLGNESYASGGALDSLTVTAMEAKVVADVNIMLPIIRKVTSKPVFICSNQWASARNWASVNGSFAAGIKDPANNWIPEVHGYGDLDGGSSGMYNSGNLNAFPVDQVVRPAYSYFAAKGLRGFVGETDIPPTDSARAALALALDEAKANGVPVTLWIAGGDGAIVINSDGGTDVSKYPGSGAVRQGDGADRGGEVSEEYRKMEAKSLGSQGNIRWAISGRV
ncbi:hypothetical protein AR540_24200 [Pseudomonas sp. EpS/L25]|nr:hypothetical protein AR540_24200 [Pseudomonas sp. EpS/L25]